MKRAWEQVKLAENSEHVAVSTYSPLFAMDVRVGELESETLENFNYTLTHTGYDDVSCEQTCCPVHDRAGNCGTWSSLDRGRGSLGTGFLGDTGHLFLLFRGEGRRNQNGRCPGERPRHDTGILVNLVSPGPVATPNAVALLWGRRKSGKKLVGRQSYASPCGYPILMTSRFSRGLFGIG